MNFLFRAFFLPWGVTLLLIVLLTLCGVGLIRSGGQEKVRFLIQQTQSAKRELQNRQKELSQFRPEISSSEQNEIIYEKLASALEDITFGKTGGVIFILPGHGPLFFGEGMISSPPELQYDTISELHNTLDDMDYLYYAESLREHEWSVVSFIQKDELFAAQKRNERILLLFSGLAILLVSSLSFRSARYAVSDLRKLEKDLSGELSGQGSQMPADVDSCAFTDFESVRKHLSVMVRELRKKTVVQHDAEFDRKFDKRLESIGTLAGGLAHDFNNLLTAIRGNLQLLQLTIQQDPDQKQYLEECETASDSAIQLINRLLTFSKGGAPVKLPVDLAGLLRKTIPFFLRGTEIKLEFELEPDVVIPLDQMQFGQVLQNLTLNARQMMNDHGSFFVSLRKIRMEKGDFPDIPSGNYAEIKCRDTGPGISAENMDKLFDPFFTTRRNGSGLGLSMCYAIVKRHSGFIDASAAPEGGAVFTILLPAPEQTGQVAVSHLPPNAANTGKSVTYAGGGHVLVMDDQASIRELLGNMLGMMNCTVAFAEKGEDAIRLYQDAVAKGTPFDVVILDLTIPSGRGGTETVAELLKFDPSVKAIAASGYSNDPVLSDYKKYGFCGILPKPFRISELNQIIQQFCGEV